jgi:hypothetical protein
MAKKKKKVNLQAQQKLQAVQHRKQYIERLRKFCTMIGNGEPLFDLLPHYLLTAIYENRGIMPKLKVAKDTKITKRFIKIMYCHLEKEIKEKYIDLIMPSITHKVNLVDYYQVILPLESVLASETCIFTGKEKFSALYEKMDERYAKYVEAFVYIIHCACFHYCDLSKHSLYTFTYDIFRSSAGVEQYTGFLYQIITLGLYPLDVCYVNIHGDRRPVVRTGEIKHNKNVSTFAPTTVSLRRLYIKDPSGRKEIPVYVQQHAVNRTMQRACCTVPGSVPALIHEAFFRKYKIICEGDRYLIECWSNNVKIGYFVGMYIDGIFVILTFLLITHSSTPEGRKLSRLTGLQRDDMKYLAIDDLKTLVNSDISQDQRMREIFIKAGCESILQMNFELHAYGYYEWLQDDTKQNTELSKLIAEYIHLGASDEEYFENE